MSKDDGENPSPSSTVGQENPPGRSKTPTWVGTVLSAKNEQVAAIKELADDKVAFMVERLAAEHQEREQRSKNLYEISQQRASDMREALEAKEAVIKRMWVVVIIQILIIASLAGVTVTGKIPFVGDIGLDKSQHGSKSQ